MQSIATIRYHYLPIRIAKTKKSNNSKCWQDCRETESLIHCWWEWKMVLLFWKIVWQLLTHLHMQLTYDLAIVFGQSQRYGNLHWHRNINGCFNHSQELETIHVPFNRWMVRQTVVRLYHRIRLSNKKHTLWECVWICGELQSEKPILKDYIL